MPKVHILPSKNGEPTALVGSRYIHSSYNPRREAQRFFSQIDPPRGVVVVIGAGLGYLDQEIVTQAPHCRILAMHLHPVCAQNVIHHSPQVERWSPQTSESAASFLANRITERDVQGLQSIEWPASAGLWPDEARIIHHALVAIIRRLSGNITTTAAFGLRWIENSLRNFSQTSLLIQPEKIHSPVVVTASGPSLEKVLPHILRHRSRSQLWALPSSLPALMREGLTPDLVIATDPGTWARWHHRHLTPEIPVAMPFNAAPLPPGNHQILTIHQGGWEEQSLLPPLWPKVALPALGTVAATAVALWKQIVEGPLFLAGLDLSWNGLSSHVRPHSFDGWLSTFESRTTPRLTLQWERAQQFAPEQKNKKRTGAALRTYADWFNTLSGEDIQLLAPSKESPSSSTLPIVEASCWAQNLAENASIPLAVQNAPLNQRQRKSHIQHVLQNWKSALQNGEKENPVLKEILYAIAPSSALSTEEVHWHNARTKAQEAVNRWEHIYGR
ncbi:MAG: DUF115 domain-containing protein [Spirochaetales bacterium]|nr:DUF115 domain-containing protein [Spirochaetales bacterium]